jgi:hypothetical protein
MKHLRIAFLVALACSPSIGNAQDNSQEKQDWSLAAKVLFAEGLVGANAWLASKSPRGWGGVEAGLVPVLTIASAVDPKASPAEPWLILIGGGAVAAYNLTVDTDKTSASQIFKTNFVALNVLLGAGVAITQFSGSPRQDRRVSVAYLPGPHSGNLVFSYRF